MKVKYARFDEKKNLSYVPKLLKKPEMRKKESKMSRNKKWWKKRNLQKIKIARFTDIQVIIYRTTYLSTHSGDWV